MDIQTLVAPNLNSVRKPARGPRAEQKYFEDHDFAFPRLRLRPTALLGAFVGLVLFAASTGVL